MVKKEILDLYHGEGKQRVDPVPEYEPVGWNNPAGYRACKGLREAVNVALGLGQPLVVTGEPGTGKTQLAASLAWELKLPLLEFYTKTTSTWTDLFYQYDGLRHFQDFHLQKSKELKEYIRFNALGIAILLSDPRELAKSLLPPELKDKGPTRSVVLIDEIDKAPRDLPNDVLYEIERMRFTVKESKWHELKAEPGYRPIVVMTSNSEKDLPDAFLRRCVFYHIEFPDAATLKQIVISRFGEDSKRGLIGESQEGQAVFYGDSKRLDAAISHFEAIRKELRLKKKPATAEFLSWLSLLQALDINLAEPSEEQVSLIKRSYSVLAKNMDDLTRMKNNVSKLLPGLSGIK